MVEKIKKYFNETASEIQKVTRPSKDEIVASTVATVVVSLVLGFFIFVVDIGLSRIVSGLLGI